MLGIGKGRAVPLKAERWFINTAQDGERRIEGNFLVIGCGELDEFAHGIGGGCQRGGLGEGIGKQEIGLEETLEPWAGKDLLQAAWVNVKGTNDLHGALALTDEQSDLFVAGHNGLLLWRSLSRACRDALQASARTGRSQGATRASTITPLFTLLRAQTVKHIEKAVCESCHISRLGREL
jgi:hypothetical protein